MLIYAYIHTCKHECVSVLWDRGFGSGKVNNEIKAQQDCMYLCARICLYSYSDQSANVNS